MRNPLSVALVVLASAAMVVSLRAQAPNKKVLYLTHSAGFKHDVLPLSMRLLPEIGRKHGFEVVATSDPASLSPRSLKSYDAVVFYTTGELPISEADKAHLLAWVRSGKGFAGIHSATDTFYQWPEYGEMIGGYFDNHPWHEEVTARIEDPATPATRHFTAPTWTLTDEIYQFRNWDRSRRHVLLSLDTRSVDLKAKGVKRTDGDFALAWTSTTGKGRVFYTALGHRAEVWQSPEYQAHLAGGIRWILGLDPQVSRTPTTDTRRARKTHRVLYIGFLCAVSVSSVSPWLAYGGGVPTLTRYEFTQPHMGTTARVVLYAPGAEVAERAATAAFARVAAIDAALSDYKPDSELSRLSRDAVGRPVRVSDDLFRVLHAAQGLAARTGGAFDITVGPLSQLWRRARRQVELPARSDMDAARATSGYALLSIDVGARTATLARSGMRLDAGGIAKGFAADEALEVVRGAGVRQALVAIGGDLAVGAAPPGARGWKVALSGLGASNAAPGSPIQAHDVGISTSGDAEQWVEIAGQRYSHIVDPRTGLGLTGHRTVTVVAGDALTSDMLATAVCVLGADAGLALVDGTPGAATLIGTASHGQESWRRSRTWRW